MSDTVSRPEPVETRDRFMGAAVDNALAFLDGAPRDVMHPEVLRRS